MKKTLSTRAQAILASTRFFYGSLAFFAAETLWILLSGRYPMAYDEGTHLGIIRLYANRWLPFWSQPLSGPAKFGAVNNDPSYLYHYLMSFPYRLLERFIHNETWQVISLRLLSLVFFAVGIVVIRRVLLRTKASRAVVHTVLALFVLTPAVPFLAAQINYDNLLFPVVGLTLLLTLQCVDVIKAGKDLPIGRILSLIIIGLLGSLIKYAFLPIFAAAGSWLLVVLIRYARQRGWRELGAHFVRSFGRLAAWSKLLLAGGVIVSAGLFTQRYGLNMIRYHTPTPECDQVLSVDQCKAYGPWERNYLTYQDKISGKLVHDDLAPRRTDPVTYTVRIWLRLMAYQLFYSFNGEIDNYSVGPPLPVASIFAGLLGAVGVVLVIVRQKYLRRHYRLGGLTLIVVVYVAALWLQEYSDFHHLGLAVAIQARYLVPVLPVLYLVGVLAYSRTLAKLSGYKTLLATVAMGVLLLEGGGAMVFILRGNSYWYWQNGPARRINQSAQKVLKKFVIGS